MTGLYLASEERKQKREIDRVKIVHSSEHTCHHHYCFKSFSCLRNARYAGHRKLMSSRNTRRILNCVFFSNRTYRNLFRLVLHSRHQLSTKAHIAVKVSVLNFSTLYRLVQRYMEDCVMSVLQKQRSCLVFYSPKLWSKIPRAQRGIESFLILSRTRHKTLILAFSLCEHVSNCLGRV